MTAPEPTVLQSPANPTVKHLVRLRHNRTRRRWGRIIVDGWRETGRAVDAGLELCGVYVSREDLDSCQAESQIAIIDAAQASGKLQLVTPAIMEKISFTRSSRGLVSEFVQPSRSIAELQAVETNFLLVLDGIEKPGNVGAVFRCADAAGVDAIIVTGQRSDLFNPNAIRSSLGAVFTMPAATASEAEAAAFLRQRQIRPLAARVESSQPLWSADLSVPLAIILGSEAEGLAERWQTLDSKPIEAVRIPMFGRIDSLNISVAAAVIAYEAMRRRKSAKIDREST